MAKIRNKVTGEVREVPDAQLGSYGITAPTPTSTPKPSYESPQAPQPNALKSVADFFAPNTTKTIANQLDYQKKLPNTKMQSPTDFKNLLGSLKNGAMATGNLFKDVFSPGQLFEAAIYAAGGVGTKAAAKPVGNVVQTGAQMARYPTKNAAFKLTEKAAAQAQERGVKGSWDEIFKRFGKDMFGDGVNKGKYKITPELQKAVNQLAKDYKRPLDAVIHHNVPAKQKAAEGFIGHAPGGGAPKRVRFEDMAHGGFSPLAKRPSDIVSPLRLLDERIKVGPTYGSPPSMIAKILSGAQATPQQKAANVLRTTMSNYLHEIAPQTTKGDKLYSLYSKGGRFGGSPAGLAAKYVGAPLALGMLGKYVGKPFSDFFLGKSQ